MAGSEFPLGARSRQSSPFSNGMLENAFFESGKGQKRSKAVESVRELSKAAEINPKAAKSYSKAAKSGSKAAKSVSKAAKSVSKAAKRGFSQDGLGRIRATKRAVKINIYI